MQNLRLIKGRIKSAKNIAQITKAMELVSASKMKRAIAQAESGKLYAEMIREMVMKLGGKVDMTSHPLLKKVKTTSKKRLVVFISTNKGLCGGLNSTLFRKTMSYYPNIDTNVWVTLGLKGAAFVTSMEGEIVADFSDKSNFVSSVSAVTDLITGEFLKGSVVGVDLVYNEFLSILKQQPKMKQILPLSVDGLSENEEKVSGDFLIEPNPEEVFESLLPSYVENQIRDAVLQAEASEHAARMVAMRNATDNAKSFIGELTLVYNKVRQEKITNEIADLVTARAAIVKE